MGVDAQKMNDCEMPSLRRALGDENILIVSLRVFSDRYLRETIVEMDFDY